MNAETYRGTRDGKWGVWLADGYLTKLNLPVTADSDSLNQQLVPLINEARAAEREQRFSQNDSPEVAAVRRRVAEIAEGSRRALEHAPEHRALAEASASRGRYRSPEVRSDDAAVAVILTGFAVTELRIDAQTDKLGEQVLGVVNKAWKAEAERNELAYGAVFAELDDEQITRDMEELVQRFRGGR